MTKVLVSLPVTAPMAVAGWASLHWGWGLEVHNWAVIVLAWVVVSIFTAAGA